MEGFYAIIKKSLESLESLSNVKQHFNLPEAAAIAKKFKSANIGRKTHLLKVYVNAAKKKGPRPLLEESS